MGSVPAYGVGETSNRLFFCGSDILAELSESNFAVLHTGRATWAQYSQGIGGTHDRLYVGSTNCQSR